MKRYLIIALAGLSTLLCSCRSVQYVPVDKVRTEYKYVEKVKYDSIYQHDSINVYSKGDTVYRDKYKYVYKYLFVNKVDSFIKTDSIQVPYPVEKKLNRWQAAKMELGGWAFGIVIAMALVIVGWLVYRWRKK